MANTGFLLVAVVAVAMVVSGAAAEKLARCCQKVNTKEITDPITGYMVQVRSGKCVQAVIFQTEKGLFCIKISAPWVLRKINAFNEAKARATLPSFVAPSSTASSSTASLLSIITSAAAASSPPPPPLV